MMMMIEGRHGFAAATSAPAPAPAPTALPQQHHRFAPRLTHLMTLPPHRRAHILLQEMAGLTSRLTEVAGSNVWEGARGKVAAPVFLAGASVPPEGLAASTTKEVLALIESHQLLLFDAIGEIAELQEIEKEKERIAESVSSKDAAMREFAKRLRDAEQVLEYTLEEYEEYLKPRRAGEEDVGASRGAAGLGTIDVQELVAYAHRISYTTFAPPEFASGQVPLRGALPPAPQEEQMRASQLYHVSDIDIGLSKPPSLLPPAAVGDTLADTGKANVESSQVPAALRTGLPLPPSIPPGWRPGMPIELPADLPPMPPGWKPGDPVSFPPGLEIPAPPLGWKPGDAVFLPPVAAASRSQEQAIPAKIIAPAPPIVPAPPGVIQVPFVQLDLNPELEEDYGSEYSDEDASSEEDED